MLRPNSTEHYGNCSGPTHGIRLHAPSARPEALRDRVLRLPQHVQDPEHRNAEPQREHDNEDDGFDHGRRPGSEQGCSSPGAQDEPGRSVG